MSDIIWYYRGIGISGQKVAGSLPAKSRLLARVALRKQGIQITKLGKTKHLAFNIFNKSISAAQITVFSRQLAILLESGIPIVQSFDILIKAETHSAFIPVLEHIKTTLETGISLSESLSQYPHYFSPLFYNLVQAGEQSGTLDIMLHKIAAYKERMQQIKRNIKKALSYPLAVFILAIVVSIGLLIFVVPQFDILFKGFDAQLPRLTRGIICLSKGIQNYWHLILGVLLLMISTCIYTFQHMTKPIINLPILGSLIKNAAIARFARTLSITFAAGLPLVDALKWVATATGNTLYNRATHIILGKVSSGQPLSVAMEDNSLFPNRVIQMIAVGEESGSLETMLVKISDYYEEQVDITVATLSSLLEPIIMSVLGILVGGLIISMYLPIFKLGEAL